MNRSTTTRPRRRQRGSTLIEALIAFLVLAVGMLAIARAQTQMRLHADVSRQRSEAVRLAHEELETLRAFAVVTAAGGATSYDAIGAASRSVDASTGDLTNTRYLVRRDIDAAPVLRAKNASVTVSWADRTGAAQQVVLHSVIGGAEPAHSGALSLARGGGAPAGRPLGRSALIPFGAKDLGNGTSAFKPVGNGTLAWVFDHLTGGITQRCAGVDPALATRDLSLATLGVCSAGSALLLSGHVRFSAASPPDAARANDAPLPASIALALTGTGYPAAPECATEAMKTVAVSVAGSQRREAVAIDATPAALGVTAWADTGERHLAYHCSVTPRPDGRWSGRTTLVGIGWTIGSAPTDRRVCRYSRDLDGSGAVDANLEHPARYADVDAPLAQQNFLVVAATEACPGAGGATIGGAGFSLAAAPVTAPHQP